MTFKKKILTFSSNYGLNVKLYLKRCKAVHGLFLFSTDYKCALFTRYDILSTIVTTFSFTSGSSE